VDIFLDDRKVATGREHLAGPGQNDRVDARVFVDVAPDVAELGMQSRVGRIHPAVLHRDAENLGMRAVEFEPRVAGVEVGHAGPGVVCTAAPVRTPLTGAAASLRSARRTGWRCPRGA